MQHIDVFISFGDPAESDCLNALAGITRDAFGRGHNPRYDYASQTGYDPVQQSCIVQSNDGNVARAITNLFILPSVASKQLLTGKTFSHINSVDLILPIGRLVEELLRPDEEIEKLARFQMSRVAMANLDLVAQTEKFNRRDEQRPATVKAVLETSEGRTIYVRGYQCDDNPIVNVLDDHSKMPLELIEKGAVASLAKQSGETTLPLAFYNQSNRAYFAKNPSLFLHTLLYAVQATGRRAAFEVSKDTGRPYIARWSNMTLPALHQIPSNLDPGKIVLRPHRKQEIYSPESGHCLIPATFWLCDPCGRTIGQGEVTLAYPRTTEDGHNYEQRFYPRGSANPS